MASLLKSSLSRAEKDVPFQGRTGPVICRGGAQSGARHDGSGTGRALPRRTVDRFDDHTALRKTADAFFEKYCDAEKTCIQSDGLEQLWKDIGLSSSGDVRALALLWHFGAERTDRLTWQRFVQGCVDINADSPDRLRREIPNVLYEAKRHFKDFYRFSFRALAHTLSSDEHSDRLSRLTAISLWKITLPLCSGDALKFENSWYRFLEDEQVETISENTWMSFSRFSQAVKEDFSNFQAGCCFRLMVAITHTIRLQSTERRVNWKKM